MILGHEDIQTLDDRYRRTFINSLAGFRQVVLIGTKSAKGYTNLAIFNSLIHLGANPAWFGFITRPDSVQRDTLENIIETKEYTFNYVSDEYMKEAHQTSARYPQSISEFTAVGLDEEYRLGCSAPFVKQAIVKIAMKFEERMDIQLNGTSLIIGSIQKVELEDRLIGIDGFIALDKEDILISCGLDAYFKPKRLDRLTYAKPDSWPDEI
ncbi:MAG TPA: flavin reductase [Cytophagaceae bacterium]|jgi:flavin reductase (DIM6/NTAB) family NADH-FMN oxidoreductase RutF